jgi:hypothetical protein
VAFRHRGSCVGKGVVLREITPVQVPPRAGADLSGRPVGIRRGAVSRGRNTKKPRREASSAGFRDHWAHPFENTPSWDDHETRGPARTHGRDHIVLLGPRDADELAEAGVPSMADRAHLKSAFYATTTYWD